MSTVVFIGKLGMGLGGRNVRFFKNNFSQNVLLLGIEGLSPEGKLFNRIGGVLVLNRDDKYMIVWLVCEAGTG